MIVQMEIDSKAFVKNLVGTFRHVRQAVFTSIEETIADMMEEMRQRIWESSPGDYKEWYFRGPGTYLLTGNKWFSRHGSHWSAEPGSPPAVLSGTLLYSFEGRVRYGHRHVFVIGEIKNTAPYASYMEYGAPSTGWSQEPLEPRPFMEPVANDPVVIARGLERMRRALNAVGMTRIAK